MSDTNTTTPLFTVPELRTKSTPSRSKASNPDSTSATDDSSFYSEDFIPSETYSSSDKRARFDNYISSEVQTIYSNPVVDTVSISESGDTEWGKAIKAKTRDDILRSLDTNLANRNFDLRNLLYAYDETAHAAQKGVNYHRDIFNDVVEKAKSHASGISIQERGPDGKPTGNNIPLLNVLNDKANLERIYLNDPAVRKALRTAIMHELNGESHKNNLRYDPNKPGIGWAIGGTVGLGVGVGLTVGLAKGIGGPAGAATLLKSLVGLLPGCIATGPVGWGILAGVAIVGAIALLVMSVNAGKYVASGRTDNPYGNTWKFGEGLGALFNNYICSLGLRDSSVKVN
jgi:hypothetical protein